MHDYNEGNRRNDPFAYDDASISRDPDTLRGTGARHGAKARHAAEPRHGAGSWGESDAWGEDGAWRGSEARHGAAATRESDIWSESAIWGENQVELDEGRPTRGRFGKREAGSWTAADDGDEHLDEGEGFAQRFHLVELLVGIGIAVLFALIPFAAHAETGDDGDVADAGAAGQLDETPSAASSESDSAEGESTDAGASSTASSDGAASSGASSNGGESSGSSSRSQSGASAKAKDGLAVKKAKTVYARGKTVAGTGDGACALSASGGGTIIAGELVAKTAGAGSPVVAAAEGSGVSLVGSKATSKGEESPLVRASGAVEIEDVSGKAAAGPFAQLSDGAFVLVSNSRLRSGYAGIANKQGLMNDLANAVTAGTIDAVSGAVVMYGTAGAQSQADVTAFGITGSKASSVASAASAKVPASSVAAAEVSSTAADPADSPGSAQAAAGTGEPSASSKGAAAKASSGFPPADAATGSPAEMGTTYFQAVGSTLESSIETGALFYLTNTKAKVVLANTELQYDSESVNLVTAAGNNVAGWGAAGSNGAAATFTCYDMGLDGNIAVDAISTLDVYLLEGSTWTGASQIGTPSSGGMSKAVLNVNVDGTSGWTLSEDSKVTNLNLQPGAKLVDRAGAAVKIVDADGNTLVDGASDVAVKVLGKFSTVVDESAASALASPTIDRSGYDAKYETNTAFGTNGKATTPTAEDEALALAAKITEWFENL